MKETPRDPTHTSQSHTGPTPRELELFLRDLPQRRLVDFAERFDPDGLPTGFKPTRAFRLIVDRYRYARKVKAPLALVTGAHGAGKTTALKHIAHHDDALLWECRPGYQPKHLLRDVSQKLGIEAGQGWNMQLSITAEQLASSPRIFMLDEAQRLDYAGLDVLKYLADASSSTFVLSASPSLEKRIERWPDIHSRCAVRVRVATMSAEEFVELYQADGFTPDALIELHRLSGGVMRTVQALLGEIDEHLETFAQKSGLRVERAMLQPGHLRQIAEKVV